MKKLRSRESKSQGLYRVNHVTGVNIKLKTRSSKKSPSDVCCGIAVDDLVDDVSKHYESVCFVILRVSD